MRFPWSRKAPKIPSPEASSSGAAELSAAAHVPQQATPRVRSGQASLPSYVRTARPNPEVPLQTLERNLANTDITKLRHGRTTQQTIAEFVRSSPDLSAAVTAYVRTAITSGYTAVANNPDGTVNAEATNLLAQIITRLNLINDYSIGFDDSPSLRSASETWAWEIMKHGAMAGELVLDSARLPYKLQPVNAAQIKRYSSKDGKRTVPKQLVAGNYIDLDYPTFFMVSLDQDTTTAYPTSPIEPAIQAVVFGASFMNDIQRIVKKAIHPRVIVTINEEKFRKSMPLEAQQDQDKADAYLNSVLEQIQSDINGLEPEEALIVFDHIGIKVTDHGNTNLSGEYKIVQDFIDAKMSTGAKALPTVLGHANSTANVASAEVLLFMKYVEGAVWGKLNEMLSKMLTLAVRLFGLDVSVTFTYNPIDLRPDSELEAFKAMKQSRVLELLSLGLLSDEEAAILLTGHLPPKGYVNKAGTGFHSASKQPVGNGYNGASNSGSTMNQNLNSDAPTGAKSR